MEKTYMQLPFCVDFRLNIKAIVMIEEAERDFTLKRLVAFIR